MRCHKPQVVLERLYWQQLSDEIISIHEVAIYCNKSQLILGKKNTDLATVCIQEEVMGDSALNSVYTVLIFLESIRN
jgi:hypothetical protein